MVKVASRKVDLKRGVDHIGVCVCFLIHDGKGNLMLHKRGTGARDENGRWDIGGGAIEFGEKIEDAVRREIKEEFKCPVLDMEFLTAYEAQRRHDGQDTHWIALVHSVRVDPTQVKNGEPKKIESIGWFNRKTLPSPLHSQFDKTYKVAIENNIIK